MLLGFSDDSGDAAMSGDNLDPGTQSALIWSNALTLLRGNATLSARQKGWFEGVLPLSLIHISEPTRR